MSQVFVSFVAEDADVAVPIARGLEEAGLTAWYYLRDNSHPGPQYLAVIGEAIQRCQAMVVVLSRQTERSPQVLSEIVQGFEQGKKLIPVLRGMTHIEFQSINPVWRGAFGAATSIELPAAGPDGIMTRLLGGLFRLGVLPHVAGHTPAPARPSVTTTPVASTPRPAPPPPLVAAPAAPRVELTARFDQTEYWAGDDALAYWLAELVVTADGDVPEDGPGVDLALVLDVSGSMEAPNRYPLLRQAVHRLVGGLRPQDRVSVTLFTDRAATVVPLRSGEAAVRDLDGVVRAMDESGLLFGNSTLLGPGLRLALSSLGSPDPARTRRTYVLTDGELHDPQESAAALAGFRPGRTEVHVYGFGDGFDAAALKRLVSDQIGGTVKPIVNEQDIVKTFAHVAAVNRRLVGSGGKLTVTFPADVVCGDAWTYRPQSRLLGPVRSRRLEYEIGGVESGRRYMLLIETRLPPTSDVVATVTAEWVAAGRAVSHRHDATVRRGYSGQPVPELRLAYDISHALRAEGDKAAQLAAFRAKRELAGLEGRDPQLLQALDKMVTRLTRELYGEPLRATDALTTEENLCVEADPRTSVAPSYSRLAGRIWDTLLTMIARHKPVETDPKSTQPLLDAVQQFIDSGEISREAGRRIFGNTLQRGLLDRQTIDSILESHPVRHS